MFSRTYIPDGTDIVVNIVADQLSGVVTAFVGKRRIGCFEYRIYAGADRYGSDSPTYELHSANIAPQYQRHGIGREMIRFGEEVFSFGNLSYPKMSNSRHENHLSSEGASLLQSCARDGIIDWEPF